MLKLNPYLDMHAILTTASFLTGYAYKNHLKLRLKIFYKSTGKLLTLQRIKLRCVTHSSKYVFILFCCKIVFNMFCLRQ